MSSGFAVLSKDSFNDMDFGFYLHKFRNGSNFKALVNELAFEFFSFLTETLLINSRISAKAMISFLSD